MKTMLRIAALALSLLPASRALAEFKNFYVGVDQLDKLASGTYAGLENPNQGRLTFLYAHTYPETPGDNHYHGIGAHSYTGDPGSAVETTTNANNRIPETYTAQPPLALLPGAGTWSGKLVSQANSEHYSDLQLGSIWELSAASAGTPEAILFNSSSGRWNSSLAGAEVWLEFVSLSSGLHIGAGAIADILLNPGDKHLLGEGNSLSFLPTFWTAGDAAPGTYSAEFRLRDLGQASGRTPFAPSGTFNFDFAVVPEPGTMVLAALGALGVLFARRNRRKD